MKIDTIRLECVSSTNDVAKQRCRTFDKSALTVITAQFQEKGRGQYGRQWISPKGVNLIATYCFFPTFKHGPYYLTLLLALSVTDFLQKESCDPKIKFPNDILIKNKKIGGILCETKDDASIVGLGLNINTATDHLQQIDQPATSLLCETNQLSDIETVLENVTERFLKNILQFSEKGFDPFFLKFEKVKDSNHPY